MNRLETEFSDRIDFIHLNIDDPATEQIRLDYQLTHRSQYKLIDAEGNTLRTWFGSLGEETMIAQLSALLDS